MDKIIRSLRSTSKSLMNNNNYNNNNNISLNKTHTNFYHKNSFYTIPKNEKNNNTLYNKNHSSSKNKKTIEPYLLNDYRPLSKDDIYGYNKY